MSKFHNSCAISKAILKKEKKKKATSNQLKEVGLNFLIKRERKQNKTTYA